MIGNLTKTLAMVLCVMCLTTTPLLASEPQLYTYNIEIVRVKDGDTFDARIDLGLGITIERTVRVEGLDTPETWRPRNAAEKQHGEAATEFATFLLYQDGVLLQLKNRYDSFGRVLARVILPSGEDYNDVMVREGFEKRSHY